jgi:hypothetical protein
MLESKPFWIFRTTISIKNTIFWVVTQCNSVDVHQQFERMYRLATNCNKKAASGARGFYRTTRRHTPEGRICHRCENLKSSNSSHVRGITREDRTQTTGGVAQTVTVSNGMFQAMSSYMVILAECSVPWTLTEIPHRERSLILWIPLLTDGKNVVADWLALKCSSVFGVLHRKPAAQTGFLCSHHANCWIVLTLK